MFQPTVLTDVPQDCVSVAGICREKGQLMRRIVGQLITGEETFGPLAALIKFSSEEEVIVSSVPAAGMHMANLLS